jgi:hypothetical protein
VRRRLTLPVATALAVVQAWALPVAASAHGISGKETLGIPRYVFAWAASVVLVLSFVALAFLWNQPRLEAARERMVLRLPRVLEPLCGVVGVAIFAIAVYAGLAGTQDDPKQNLLPVLLYVHFWVGIPIASLLFGDVFRAFNPWRAIARGVAAAGRAVGIRRQPPWAYPPRWGRWPAALGILVFAAIELVYSPDVHARGLAVLAIAYTVFQLAGMTAFGIERWADRADPFGVYFGLFARLSPLHWQGGRLSLRSPLAGLPRLAAIPGTVAMVCIMIGTTSFDGLENTSTWRSAWNTPTSLGKLSALLAMVLLIGCFYRLGTLGMRSIGQRRRGGYLAARFAHTLIPIAFAYVVAHYFSLLATEGQALGYLVSDPLGNGSDFFGTASATVDLSAVSTTVIWFVQVIALIAGHVGGLTAAHDRALVVYDADDAARSQYWMLAVMVGFTCLGLWLLSA